ncbi:hypothetical protein F4808DRAFT_198979 [Astrocystis sublimbata]|nr:hypothetical protein F4808DRAFT_198979 [Astrocystis sublimbata]
MTYIFCVAYAQGCTFDMEYYLAKHMPLVQKEWTSYGLKSWKVAKFTNEESPYAVQAWLEWESKEHADKGIASAGGANVFADVPTFSNVKPVVLSGDEVGSAVC